MINQAFTQWAEYPVITTLETISAPIDEIQFPTVTVCDQKPPDNWGPLEKVLNSLAFECSGYSNCKESTEIRQDFKFLIDSFVEACLQMLNEIDYKTLTEAPMFKDDIANYNESGVIDIVAEVLKQGKKGDLIDLAIQKFATDLNAYDTATHYIISEIKDLFGANYDTFKNCTSEICKNYQKSAVRILLMLRWTRVEGIPFGSFMSQFIHTNKFKSFGSCRHDLCHYTNDMFIECNKLEQDERKLHDYLTKISKSFGFNESELLSLYELPGMLADDLNYAKYMKIKGKTQNDNLLGDIPQAYLYSTCKERENVSNKFYYFYFEQCKWQEDELNETGIFPSFILVKDLVLDVFILNIPF